MTPTRLARNLSAAVVAGIAAWSSYHHMVEVALGVGERPDVAYLVPLSVDGMLVVASVAMVDDKRAGRRVRASARLAFVVGVAASVGANIAAAQPTIGARVVAAWPAVALLLVVELLSRTGRLLRHGTAVDEDTDGGSAESADSLPVAPMAAQVVAQIPAPADLPPAAPVRKTAPAKKPITDAQVRRILRDPIKVPRDPDGTVPPNRLAKRAGIGNDRAARVIDEEGLTPPARPSVGEAPVNGYDHDADAYVDA